MLRMRRHSILSAPGVFQMENRFSRDLSPEFFGFKKFLTKTLFLLRHSMPLKSEMVWVPLCSTLKPLLLWVTQITLFSIPFLFVTSMKIGSVNRIDKEPLRRLFVFCFKLRQSENTERIVNSPNFLFLILKTKKLCSN